MEEREQLKLLQLDPEEERRGLQLDPEEDPEEERRGLQLDPEEEELQLDPEEERRRERRRRLKLLLLDPEEERRRRLQEERLLLLLEGLPALPEENLELPELLPLPELLELSKEEREELKQLQLLQQQRKQLQQHQSLVQFILAMKEGHISLNIRKCIFQGPPRVGKTHVKCLLLEQQLTDSLSTKCADQPVQALRDTTTQRFGGIVGGKWLVMDNEMLTRLMSNIAMQLDVGRSLQIDTGLQTSDASRMVKEKMIDNMLRNNNPDAASNYVSANDPLQDLLYLIDSGGQPQFQNVLQAFVPNTTVLILAINLTQKLSDPPLMQYESEHGSHNLGKYAISNEEIIAQFARTLYCNNKNVQLAIVGTHYDQYQLLADVHETINKKNEKLLEIFSFCKERLLYSNAVKKELLFPVNGLQARDGIFDDPAVCKLRSAICPVGARDVEKVEVPIRWYAFELALQKQATITEKCVLSLSQCEEIAANLHFPAEDVPCALEYLSKYNLIGYYPTTPNVVFTTSQILLDKVTELAERVYMLGGAEPIENASIPASGEYLFMFKKGIITKRILGDFQKHYIEGLFTEDELLKIFESHYIVARIDEGQYFMPALLPHFTKCELEKLLDPSKPPLLFSFTDGCAPNGLFCALIVCLTSPMIGWKLKYDSGVLDGVKSNAVCLYVPKLGLICILVDSYYHFEIHCRTPGCEQYLYELRETVSNALEEVIDKRKYNITPPNMAFLCRSDHQHLIGLHRDGIKHHIAKLIRDNEMLDCSMDPGMTQYRVNEIESQWLAPVQGNKPIEDKLRQQPSLTAAYNAVKSHSADWEKIGRSLNVPINVRNKVRIDIFIDIEGKLEKMLEYWLEAQAESATWSALINALKSIELNNLAMKIKTEL